MIDNSEIGEMQKSMLKTAVEQARDNPDVLQGVLDQIKTAMGQ
ncbi:MAG: hypothetical protein AAGK28_15370 [Pseudomonadota bacterium]